MIVTDIVIDHATFERHLRRLTGTDPGPVDDRLHAAGDDRLDPGQPNGGDGGDSSGGVGPVGYRCSTLDGHPIDPTEAVANALTGHVRRVVIGADSVVTELGRRRRLFTGPAQLAVKLASSECYWPGCHVPVSDCQIDHLIPWADHGGGPTNPGNGGPACGRHNRHKHGFATGRGYTVHRD